MEQANRTPQVIYDAIMAAARHPKSAKAIANIKLACDDIDEDRIAITVARVGKRTKDKEGGPTAASLRNNKEFMAYVHARTMEQKLPESTISTPTGTYLTNDPEANAIIYMLEARANLAEGKLRIVTSSLAERGDSDLAEFLKQKQLTLARLPPGQPPPPQQQEQPENHKLYEIMAKLLDPQHMEPFGLVKHNYRIKSPERNFRVFFEKDEVETLSTEVDLYRQRMARKKPQ